MFKNIGNSLMRFAKFCVVVGYVVAIICVIGGLMWWEDIYGLLVGACIGLCELGASYIGAMFIYGFGQLVNDVREIKSNSGNENILSAELTDELPDL